MSWIRFLFVHTAYICRYNDVVGWIHGNVCYFCATNVFDSEEGVRGKTKGYLRRQFARLHSRSNEAEQGLLIGYYFVLYVALWWCFCFYSGISDVLLCNDALEASRADQFLAVGLHGIGNQVEGLINL
jgi:hypothetical protein